MTDGRCETAKAKRWPALVICLLVVCSFALRLAPLGRYVTPDEPAWVYRSVRFADALVARDWSAVPSTGHPGVTTMWIGAAGVALRRLVDSTESVAHLDWIRRLVWLASENGEAFPHLSFFLPFGRVGVALTTALALVAAYWLTARVFERHVALLTVGLLAFDPFLVGHSGFLHTDALLATFCLLALLAVFNALESSRSVLWWALSGVLTGLALLTKAPALILLPFILLMLVVHLAPVVPRSSNFATCLFGSLGYYALFLLLAALTLFVLYPALWADPLGVLQTIGGFAGRHVETVQRPVFFAGEMTYDPGPAFYPAVFLFRVSPLVLVGLVVGLVRLRRLQVNRRLAFLVLLGFALLFGAAMSLGAKKHDRYLLPALPPLALAAALSFSQVLGLEWGGGSAAERPDRPAREARHPRLLLLIGAQLVLLLPFALHPLTYYNPLAGGPFVAARVLPMGWGEGAGAAARWLNRLPQADQLTVATASVPSLASLFTGRAVPVAQASLADYLVGTPNLPSDQPAHVVNLSGLEYTSVLTNTAPLEQAAYLAVHVGPDDLILLDADTPLLRRYEGPGALLSAASQPNGHAAGEWLFEQAQAYEAIWVVASPGASPITAEHLREAVEATARPVSTATVAGATISRFIPRSSPLPLRLSRFRASFGGQLELVDGALPRAIAWPDSLSATLRWRVLGTPFTDYRAVVTLRDEDGRAWSTTEMWVLNSVFFPTSAWTPGEWADATYELELPAGIPPGPYSVEVGLYDGVTGAGLGATGPEGAFRGTRVVVGEVSLSPPEVRPELAALEVPERLDIPADTLTLLGLAPPPGQVLSGDHLPFALFWQAEAAPVGDYGVHLRLLDSAGEAVLETVDPLSPYPTSRWREGDRFQTRHDLHVLPDLPPGRYWLTLIVVDEGGEAVWEEDRALAELEVLPRERSFELSREISHPLDLTFGERIHLKGYDLGRREVMAGGTLDLALYWRAKGPTERDYALFVHLLGPDGLVRGQVDRTPGGGLAPTSSWATGQVIVEEVGVPVAADAPPGTYRIAIGFYNVAHGDRLDVTGPGGEPLPDSQAVLPVEITIAGGAP